MYTYMQYFQTREIKKEVEHQQDTHLHLGRHLTLTLILTPECSEHALSRIPLSASYVRFLCSITALAAPDQSY